MSGKQKIALPGELVPLAIRGVDALAIKWSRKHTYSINSFRWLEKRHDPHYDKLSRRWAERDEPLWWYCLTTIRVGGPKRVVRSWLNNRVKVAFKQALEERGYSKNGSRLHELGGIQRPSGEPSGDLVGSVQFIVQSRLLRTPWPDLKKQASLIVMELEKRLIF